MAVYYQQQDAEEDPLTRLAKIATLGSAVSTMKQNRKKAQAQEMFQQFLTGGGKGGAPGAPGMAGAGGPNITMGGGMGITGININPTTGNASFSFGQSPDAKRMQENKAKLDEYSSSAVNGLQALNKINEQAAQLGDFERGFGKQTGSKIGVALKQWGKDKDVSRYVTVVQQELIPLARNLAEEKGPISNTDVDHLEQAIAGDLTAPLEDKLFATEKLRKKVQLALQNKFENAGIPMEKLHEAYPTLFEQLTTNYQYAEDKHGNRAVLVRDFQGNLKNQIDVKMFGKKGKK